MRITSSMMMEKYKDFLSKNLDRLSDASDKVSTQKKFTRASQDPVNALKALKTTRQLNMVNTYQNSADVSTSWLTAVESNVSTIDKIIRTASTNLLEAQNGVHTAEDGVQFTAALENYRTQMLQMLNTSFNGQFIYGGNENGPAPFKIGTADDFNNNMDGPPGFFTIGQVEGKLLYNIPNTDKYVPVSVINNLTDTSNPYYKYSVYNPNMKYTMPIDLGFGMKIDAQGNIAAGTAFDAAASALDFLVQDVTVDASGVPTSKNVIDELSDAAARLKSGDYSTLGGLRDLLTSTQNAELNATVVLGEKSRMLEFLGEKMTTDQTNLTTRLSVVQDVDATQAILDFNVSQVVYNASLAISSQVLQNSLIDFLK